MIVFAAFTPHTPLLIPSIGKEQIDKLQQTTQAFEELSEELYASHPETIAIVSNHNTQFENTFSINLHDSYKVDLSDFGDLTTANIFRSDLNLIDSIQRRLRRENVPITLNSDEILDHGTAIPLILLTKNLPKMPLVPISNSGLDAKEHFEYGRALKELLQATNKRVAVIATGDLSHALTSEAPAGFRKEGPEFDAIVRDSVASLTPSKLLKLDGKFIEAASECGFNSLMILMGILDGMNVRPQELSYESPFGVGYLTANFKIKK